MGLPDTPHYEDKIVRSFSRQLWEIWRDVYKDEYETAATVIAAGGVIEEEPEDVELAIADRVSEATHRLRQWTRSSKWIEALDKTKSLFTRIANRASKVELRRVNASGELVEEDRDKWIADHLADFAASVADTTRAEIRDFIARQMEEQPGITQEDLAQKVREHFVEFPDWKADRLARTETANVYRAATLLAAQAAEINRVQAIDAQYGPTDDDCEQRDGQIFDVDAAWNVTEHPNGTLAWRMVPTELSIDYDDISGAKFDPEAMRVTLSADLTPESEYVVLRQVMDHIVA